MLCVHFFPVNKRNVEEHKSTFSNTEALMDTKLATPMISLLF